MPGPRVFVSYDHSEDAHYKRLLEAWHSNEEFDFSFDLRSPSVPVNSEAAAPIRRVLTQKLRQSEILLVLVGARTKDSAWVNWEIERAKQPDLRLRLAAVKLSPSNASPPGLLGVGTAWATSFRREPILSALRNAAASY